MQQLIKVFFSPMVFALGFLWPLSTQLVLETGLVANGWAWVVGVLVVLPFALMAQIRGSWIWIK